MKKNFFLILFCSFGCSFSQNYLLQEIEDSVWARWAKAKHVKEIRINALDNYSKNWEYGWFKFDEFGRVIETTESADKNNLRAALRTEYDEKGRVIFYSVCDRNTSEFHSASCYQRDSTVYLKGGGFRVYSKDDETDQYELTAYTLGGKENNDTLFVTNTNWEKVYSVGDGISIHKYLYESTSEEGLTYFDYYSAWWEKKDKKGRLLESGPMDFGDMAEGMINDFQDYGIPDSIYLPYVDFKYLTELGVMEHHEVNMEVLFALHDWFLFLWSDPIPGKYLRTCYYEYGPHGLSKQIFGSQGELNCPHYEYVYDDLGQLIELRRYYRYDTGELKLVETLFINWKNGLPSLAMEDAMHNGGTVTFYFSYTFW